MALDLQENRNSKEFSEPPPAFSLSQREREKG